MESVVTGLVCSVCDARVDIATPLSWRCPNSSDADRHHVLRFESRLEPFRPAADDNPFLAFRRWLAVDAFGERIGLDESSRAGIISDLDNAIASVAGIGFRTTPLSRADELSNALGFTPAGGIWVKDETHNVAGSHKARHLMTELLHLLFAEAAGRAPWASPSDRPPLAIASCGNAAIAASTLAAAVKWPVAVHVPVAASESVLGTLSSLNADVRVCPRQVSDPAGDPCVFRFREAVADGAIPFGVQGTENAWCLDGGRTIGWEIFGQMDGSIDRIFIQVGGGAFASSVASSMKTVGLQPRLHAVQTEGCAPLARAWQRALDTGGVHNVAKRWAECMWPWETEPHSLADGILDDETYDWIGIVEGMASTGGSPVVASEASVVAAHRMSHDLTSVNVSPTGSAGLAGLLEMREHIDDDERVVVVMSGVQR
jgi:threonine synthase